MGKQLNIRSEKARARAIELSRELDASVVKVVEDALAAYRPELPRRLSTDEVIWSPLLEIDQRTVRESDCDFEINDLYDPETGLPV